MSTLTKKRFQTLKQGVSGKSYVPEYWYVNEAGDKVRRCERSDPATIEVEDKPKAKASDSSDEPREKPKSLGRKKTVKPE